MTKNSCVCYGMGNFPEDFNNLGIDFRNFFSDFLVTKF